MEHDLLNQISPDPLASYRAAVAKRFVSLWDMLQLQAETFLPALTLLASAVGDLTATRNIGRQRLVSATMPLETKAYIINGLEVVMATAEQHELKMSLKAAKRCHQTFFEMLVVPGPMSAQTLDTLIAGLEGLLRIVIDEAESRKFYTLKTKAESDHASADDLFGQAVVGAFPTAVFDIEEAGRCLAFELWTAAVMHLMRALEPALVALSRHVGVDAGPNWNQTLDQIEKQLRQVTRREDGAEAEEWASEAGAQLRFIKNAWRNRAMHSGTIYDERRARTIFETTRSLMQHLAEKLETA